MEIDGDGIDNYIKSGGANEEIQWIRYEEINQLAYVYCMIGDRKVTDIRFDVYCEWSEDEFIDNVNALTQAEYYNKIEEYIKFFNNQDFKVIGEEEELTDLKFVV